MGDLWRLAHEDGEGESLQNLRRMSGGMIGKKGGADQVGAGRGNLQERSDPARRVPCEACTGLLEHRQAEQDSPDVIVPGGCQPLAHSHEALGVSEEGSQILLAARPGNPADGGVG